MAQATRCVKLTLLRPSDSRCLFRIRRFSSSVRTGISRSEVAVGTWRLASMFSTMRRAPPRMGWAMSPGRMAGSTTAFVFSERERPAKAPGGRPRPVAARSPPLPPPAGSGSGARP